MFQHFHFSRFFVWVALTFLIFFLPSTADAAQGDPKNVLILHSYHSGYLWTDQVSTGIKEVFGRPGVKIEPYSVHMDMKRTSFSDEYILRFKDLLRLRYQKVRFDLVLAVDNDALEFLRKNRDALFPGVPVVFVGINDYDPRMLDGRADITGLVENTSYAETIALALKLRPATRTIVVVTDNSTTGRAHASAVAKIEPLFIKEVKFQHLSLGDLTFQELGDKLAVLDGNAAVLLLHHFVDKDGVSYSTEESTAFLTARAAVPCFAVNASRMGFGALGGKVSNGYYHGVAAAEMAVRILNGVPVGGIPVLMDSPNKYIFDYFVMRRFNVPERLLPQGSFIINKPVPFFVKYRTETIIGSIIFFLLCAMIVILVFYARYQTRTKEALRESEAKHRLLFENAGDAIFIHDEQMRIRAVNPAACKMLGYTHAELMSMLVRQVDAPEQAQYIPERIAQIMKQGYCLFETVHCRKDGSRIPVEASVRLITWDGQPAMMSLCRDITERKKAEEVLNKAKEGAEEISRLKSEFLSNVAHDFRTPVHAIMGFSAFLQSGKMTEKEKKFAGIINESSRNLLRLVEDLLDVSRLETGRLELRVVEFDPKKCVINAVEVGRAVLMGTGVKLLCSVQENIPLLKGDESRFHQVLANLIGNAVKYTDKGEIVVRVDADQQDRPKGKCRVRVSVKDTGLGIRQDHLSKIFDPFSRFHEFEGGKARGGEGLGLYIVKTLVNFMKGEISVVSEVGKGSEFVVTLDFDVAMTGG